MLFSFTVADLINALFIAGGIGVCGLCLLQITASIHLRKEVRHYFQVFFLLLLFYISTHLARQIMDGLPGAGVRTALYIITFSEILAAGFMAHIMSLLVLAVAKLKKKTTLRLVALLYGFLFLHTVLLIASAPFDLIYTFDADNVYHRSAWYLLSNIGPVSMLVFDAVMLIRSRAKLDKQIKIAFWNYMIAPVIAIALQSFTQKIQYIIFATVGASIYMFAVIVWNQNVQYAKQKIESARIDTELSMASAIQADMLPNIYPAFPERPEFDIYATMDPAKEVGGDFYDFFLVDDDHLCMVMADVSGKGVPAALFMMASKIMLANNAMLGKSPAQILTDTNAAICSNNREEMFVTVWLGILELSTGRLTCANAGHEYPVMRQKDGKFELVKDKHGFVIGGMDGIRYKEYRMQMEPGAKLFLYTDGVPEATNAEKELFGTDRMVDALNEVVDASPQEILKNVRRTVDGFVRDAEQFDDLTMLCLEYVGTSAAKKPVELTVEASVENLEKVFDFVHTALEKCDCSPKAQMQIDVAVEEIYVNVAHYAYAPGTGAVVIRLEISEDPAEVTITFIDSGTPYDPLKKADPDTTLSAEERQIGGLGIFMTKKVMDEITYKYQDNKNVLTMKKKLS